MTNKENNNRQQQVDIDKLIHEPARLKILAQLYDVMKLQADLLANLGVTISVAEQLMAKRVSEVERRLLPVNHARAVDAAKTMGIPMMCVHTPSDNCVANFLTKTVIWRNLQLLMPG